MRTIINFLNRSHLLGALAALTLAGCPTPRHSGILPDGGNGDAPSDLLTNADHNMADHPDSVIGDGAPPDTATTDGPGSDGTTATDGRGTGDAVMDAPADALADGVAANGIMIIAVPYTAASTTGPLIYTAFASQVTLNNGDAANFTMCVSSSTATPLRYTFQPFVDSLAGGDATYGAITSFATLTTCPTMTTVHMPISMTIAVDVIGLSLTSVATDAGGGVATLEIDSIIVTPNNPVGPYTFDSTVQGFMMSSSNAVAGTTVSWRATP
jgi:hypothetical protein